MIDKATVDRIYAAADIVEVVSDFVSLRKKGVNYQACCPFHNEKTPSFVVSPTKGLYKCFGCGKGGNAVTFVMEHEGMSYVEALKYVAKKYGQPRKTQLYYPGDEDDEAPDEEVPDYPVNLFFTGEGYFKKITPLSLRMGGAQKLKEGDSIAREVETSNAAQLLFFTDKQQVYKADVSDFADTKASVLGDFIPAKLGFDDGEAATYMAVTRDYSGYLLFFFENGKAAKVDMKSYETKQKRKKLLAAYSDKSPCVAIFHIDADGEFLLRANNEKTLLLHSGALIPKTTKNTQGVQVMTLRKNRLERVVPYTAGMLENDHRFRSKSIPSAGASLKPEDKGEQLRL